MTELLLKIFVRDRGSHASVGKFAGAVGIVCNIILTLGKLAVGALAGSVSVIADGMNNLSDAASSAVTLFGFRLSERPADRDHPYGHGRYEYIAGTVVAAMILAIGVELAKTSVEKIFSPEPISVTAPLAATLLLSVAVKLWLSRFYGSLGKMIGSETLFASSADSRNDVISTAAVLIGCGVEFFFHVNIDGYVGLLVAVFITASGVGIARDAVSPLIGKRADTMLTDEIERIILSHGGVLGMHDLLVHDYGPGRIYASAHVELDAGRDVMYCHNVIDGIEREIAERTGVEMVLHVDPVVTDDAEQNEAEALIASIIKGLDPEYSMHDFRIARGAGAPTLVFDLAVPYGQMEEREHIEKMIGAAISASGKNYKTQIRFDGE